MNKKFLVFNAIFSFKPTSTTSRKLARSIYGIFNSTHNHPEEDLIKRPDNDVPTEEERTEEERAPNINGMRNTFCCSSLRMYLFLLEASTYSMYVHFFVEKDRSRNLKSLGGAKVRAGPNE